MSRELYYVYSEMNTKFQKGISGNPNGRPKLDVNVREIARQHGEEAILKLVSLLNSKDEKVVLAAAEKILDRGFGKPAQTHEVGGAADNPVIVQHGLSPEAAALVEETLKGLGK